jgi:hypothetical protein
MKISRTGIVISALPGVLALALICSLAVHIRLLGWQLSSIPLGRWPASLDTHFAIWSGYFITLLYCSIFVVPVAIVVCLVVSRWRYFALYLAVHTMMFLAIILVTEVVPESFHQWLLD